MSNTFTRTLSAALIALMATGCASKQEVTEAAEVTTITPDRPDSEESNIRIMTPISRAQRKAKVAEAEAVMKKLAFGAKVYMASEQKITGVKGSEPWHLETDSAPLGLPVRWDNYVFPGSTSFTFSTHDEIPQGGELSMPKLTPAATDSFMIATLNKLGVTFSEPTYFRYTYTTGEGTGANASVIITAEANFNIDSPEAHTITQEIGLDSKYNEVFIAPPFTTNELE